MSPRISVITAALPTRLALLHTCVESVNAQTLPPVEHCIAIDHERAGTGAVKTRMLAGARGDWIAPLDDDDVLLSNHLATLAGYAPDADVVYSFCRVEGRDGWNPNRTFDAAALRQGNFIPATALIRRELAIAVGGWRDSASCPHGWEDWDFWLRCLDLGARFVCAPSVTWVYRFHGRNKTYHGEQGAS